METRAHPSGLQDVLEFPLVEALFGRRARRFSLGASIPDGPLAFTSRHEPLPLSELEQMLVLTAAAGNTGWHYMIMRHARYAPHLSNYSGAAGGRTFPSAAGFHTSELFFTDDEGVYLFETRDAPALVEQTTDGPPDLDAILDAHRARIRKLSDGRLYIPAEEPYMEGHNTWCANRPGSTLLIPVGDIAQHMIAVLCFMVQNGYGMYDDVNGERIPGLERFSHLVDLDEPLPLTFMETYSITECTAELSTSCYAGMLMLQAMGLGGWMFDGIDRYTVLGQAAIRRCLDWAFATTPTSAGRCRTLRVYQESSQATALPTIPTCGPLPKPSPGESSVREDRSILTRRVPGRRAPGFGAVRRSTPRSSRSAWRSWRRTSTTASGSSPAPSRASSY
jgi:hypothetical protein